MMGGRLIMTYYEDTLEECYGCKITEDEEELFECISCGQMCCESCLEEDCACD